MIGGAAICEIMMMVGYKMGVDAVLLHNLGERIIKGFQRPPAAMQEMAAASVKVAARRHAGQAADIVIVKGHRPLLEPDEIRRVNRLRAIGLHGISVQ